MSFLRRKKMSKPVTRGSKSTAGWNGRSRRPARPLPSLREMGAQRAWVAAVRVRKALQGRIVFAFRKHIEGSGPGPVDAELLMFARLAIAEQRLKRSLAQAKGKKWECGDAQIFSDPSAVLHRGEHQ
ncbi:hypothetical protein J7E62_25320 [Variovorax paradoxus]|nr:hypothetical protein [Variovorax paradoxus]